MTIYLLKVICCSGMLLLVYEFFLGKEKMLRFNRFYLLFAVVFSFCIPLIVVQKTAPTNVVDEIIVSMNPAPNSQTAPPIASQKAENTEANVPLLIYGVISAAMLFRFGRNLLSLLKSIRQNEKSNFEHVKVVLLNSTSAPYSFFHYVFVSKDDFNSGKVAKQILQHEVAHAMQKHSLDILFMEIVLIFGWVNPILFLYRKVIQLNHEFLADENATATYGIREYQLLLINEPSPSENLRLTSSFNYSFTKKRLIMMTKTTSLRTVIAKEFALLPLVFLCAFVFGDQAIAQQVKKVNKQSEQAIKQAQQEAHQAQKASEQAQNDAQQAQKASLRAQRDAKQAQGASREARMEIKDSKNNRHYIGVTTLRSSQPTPAPTEKMWSVKQGDSTLSFKSSIPLSEVEKKQIEKDFAKIANAPLPKFTPPAPTQAQLDSFLDDTVYRVWINGKRVYNFELKLYTAKDFSEVWVSALMKNARDYGKYLFHVELKKKGGC